MPDDVTEFRIPVPQAELDDLRAGSSVRVGPSTRLSMTGRRASRSPISRTCAATGQTGTTGRARRAAVELSGIRSTEDDSLGVRLLADARTVFHREELTRLSSKGLCDELPADPEARWAYLNDGLGLTQRSLAGLLRSYGIRSTTVRLADDSIAKGYKVEDFEDAWERYLPPNALESVTSVTTA